MQNVRQIEVKYFSCQLFEIKMPRVTHLYEWLAFSFLPRFFILFLADYLFYSSILAHSHSSPSRNSRSKKTKKLKLLDRLPKTPNAVHADNKEFVGTIVFQNICKWYTPPRPFATTLYAIFHRPSVQAG